MGLQNVIADSNLTGELFRKDFEGGEMRVRITELGPPIRILTSTGYFPKGGLDSQIVKVKLKRGQTSVAKYAWYIEVSGGDAHRAWITGDNVWGRVHSNMKLLVNGYPVFYGKVTTLQGWTPVDKKKISHPIFKSGYEDGIDVDMYDKKNLHVPDYKTIAGTATFDQDLWLTFNADGTVTYRIPKDPNKGGQESSNYGDPVTVSLDSFAPNGVIYVDKANVYLSGTLSGKVTVVCDGSSGPGGPGNVFLEGDMTYKTDPMISDGNGGYMINPESVDSDGKPKDLMGIVAANSIFISTLGNLGGQENNTDGNVNIDAGIFCNMGGAVNSGGGFWVQDFGPLNNNIGYLTLKGSMVSGNEGTVVELNSKGEVISGFKRNVIFDERFAVGPPIWFPYFDYYGVISWLE